jgi:hypothetical protein
VVQYSTEEEEKEEEEEEEEINWIGKWITN